MNEDTVCSGQVISERQKNGQTDGQTDHFRAPVERGPKKPKIVKASWYAFTVCKLRSIRFNLISIYFVSLMRIRSPEIPNYQ